MTAGPVVLRRPLAPSEEGTWLMDAGSPVTFVLIARVAGPVQADHWRAALVAWQERHPQLRARIVTDGDGRPAFTPDAVGPLSLRVVQGAAEDWTAEAEDELVRPFAPDGPLARVVWLEHGAASAEAAGTLLVTFHHVIADGRSAFAALGDLLVAAGQEAAGERVSWTPSAWTAPLEACLPDRARGPRAAWRRGLFLARTLWRDWRHGRPARVRRDLDLPAHQRRHRVASVTLGPGELAGLQAQCRARGCTVHGALAAALLMALVEDLDPAAGAAPRVALGTPVDIRPELDPAPGDGLGLLVSSIVFEQRVPRGGSFWDLVERIQQASERSQRRGEVWSSAVLTPRVVEWMGGRRLSPREFVEGWEARAAATCGLTNVGVLDLPERCGPLRVQDVQAISAPGALTDVVVLAMTFAGRLRINLMWPDPVLERCHALDLAAALRRRLGEASRG